MGNESYYAQIPKLTLPFLNSLIQGNTLNSGNIGLGGIGGTLASFIDPHAAPVGSYAGGVLGSALQPGATLGSSLLGGLPSLGIGLLGQLIPEDFQQGGQPLLNMISNIVMGASPLTIFGGGILSSVLNIIGDISAENDVNTALREIEESVINAYGQNAPQMENLYSQLSQYIPEANQNQSWNQQMSSLPEWAQPLLQGGRGLQSEEYFTQNPLMMFTSPLIQTFSDPQLTQQLISGLFGGLQNPEQANFSQWKSLTPQQKKQIMDQMKYRSRLPAHEEDQPRPVSAQEWLQLSNTMGSQTSLDPLQILGGMYQQLFDLEQANPNALSQSGQKVGAAALGNLNAATYIQPQRPMQSPTSNSSLVEGSQLPQSITAENIFNNLFQSGFYKDILGGPAGYEYWKNGPNLSEYLDPVSNTMKSLSTGTKGVNPSLSTYLGGNTVLSPVGTTNQSSFTPGALQAVYNSGLGLPNVEEYIHTPEALDQIMHTLNLMGSQFVH